MINLLTNKLGEIKPSQWFFGGTIALFAIVHIFIYCFMPYTCDDYWYMTSIAEYCKGIDTAFPFENLWSCWVDHFHTDNIRLSNIIFTLTLLIPKVVTSILSGVVVGIILWLSLRLSCISWKNPLLTLVVVFMLSFMLPWYEEMFTQCFALNYIWSTGLALWLAYLFFYKERLPKVTVAFLLGVLMGAWHEGIAGPLLVGFVVYVIMKYRTIEKSHYAIMIGIIFGLLWLTNAPGLQMNVGYKTKTFELTTILSKLVLYHIPLMLLLISIVVAIIKKDTRRIVLEPIFVSFVAICLVGVVLNLITNVGVRTGWMGYLFGIIATLYLWKQMKVLKYGRVKSIFKRAFALILAIFLLAHFVTVVCYARKIKIEFDNVLTQYHKSADGAVFADVTYDFQASPLAWKKPYFEIFSYDWVMFWMDKYYNNCEKKMRVIPTCLYNADELEAVKVPGDNPFMIYDGYLYAPVVNEESLKDNYYQIDFGLSNKVIRCSNFMFTTQSGKKYYFSFPQRATLHLWIGEIKKMDKMAI